MLRRDFMSSLLTATAAPAMWNLAWRVEAAAPSGKTPLRLWYNNDTANIVDLDSPFHKRGDPLTDKAIEGTVDEVAGRGVDAYAFCAGLGHIPVWKSTVYPDHFSWWMKKTGRPLDVYGRYLLDGGDMVRVVVERCRRHGMAPYVSFRMNDVHMQENVGRNTPASVWVSRFYEENPDLLLEPDHATRHPTGYYPWRGQNWAKDAVRMRKLAFLKELCENYDLAGVELDWLRDQHVFPRGFPADEAKAIMSGFLREVRQLLDRTMRDGRRRYLGVRVPVSVAAHAAFGFDVARAVAAGVDIFNCSGWYFSQPITDLAEIRRAAPGAVLLQELTHTAGRLVPDPNTSGYGTETFPRTSDAMYYTAAHLAYERGADGVSLFNFAYYRLGHGNLAWLVREPPFHVLPKLRDRDWLSRQPQLYWLAPWVYGKQVQRPIATGQSGVYHFDLALPKGPLVSTARLRAVCSQPLTDVRLAASVNGRPLESTTDLAPPQGYAYDGMLGALEKRRAWICPSDLLSDGPNIVRITVEKATSSVTPEWLDLAISPSERPRQ
jgi:hypothetical protein